MARMGRSTVQKRLSAPLVYHVPRKPRFGRFVTKTGPGPHPRDSSIDMVTLLRDLLKLVRTRREAMYAIKRGGILVDGVSRRDHKFPIGLMDVVEIPAEGVAYRMVPKGKLLLHPVEIRGGEESLKLVLVRNKVTVRGGVTQLGGHDGRCFLVDDAKKYKTGDGLLIKVPSQEVVEHIPLEEGVAVLVIGGSRISSLGRVLELVPGAFGAKPAVKLDIEGEEVVVPKHLVMPVGRDKPLITVRG